jgi:tetratricopeptide (TPR) repeat protein
LSQQFEKAVEDFDRFIRRDSKVGDAYLNRGASHLFLGDTLKAMNDYNTAISLNRFDPEGYIRRSRIHIMQKNTAPALEDLTSAISLDSTNTFAFFNRALVRYDNKDIMGALKDLEKVLELDPGNALTLYNRALIRSQIGDYNNAIDDYDRVITINPNNVLAYYNRASVFVQLGRYRDAMDDYSQAINLYPDFANAYMNRSYVKNQLGQFTSAKSDFDIAQKKVREYRSLQSDSTGVSAFADTTRKYDRLLALDADFAKRDFNNELLQYRDVDIRLKPLYKFRPDTERKTLVALENRYEDNKMNAFTSSLIMPVSFTSVPPELSAENQVTYLKETDILLRREKNGYLLFAKALLESGNKQFNTALECYNQAISLEPDQTFYYINRGALQSEMIDFISSMESNVQVLTLDNAGATRAKVQENVTRSYDYTAAIHDMKRAAELSPEFPYTYYNLGNLYCLSNDLPESIIQYSKAIELFPHIGEAYYNRGLVQIYLQDKEKGCMDMSKAGELGIPEAYSVIKKYCTVEGK